MLSLIASSECCTAICVRTCIVRVSVGLLGLYRSFFIIGGRDCSFLRLCGVLLWSIVGFALTAIGSFVLTDNGMEYLCVRSLDCMGYLFSCSFSRTNAFYGIFAPGIIGEMGLHHSKLA